MLEWMRRWFDRGDEDDAPVAFTGTMDDARGFDTVPDRRTVDRSPVIVESQEGLAALEPGFKDVIRKVDVGAVLASLCPVEFEDATVGILVVQDYVGSDASRAVLEELRKAGYTMAQRPIIVVPAHVLLWIQRGSLTVDAIKARKKLLNDREQSALLHTFQDILTWATHYDASDIHLNLTGEIGTAEVAFTVGGRMVRPERFDNMKSKLLSDVLGVLYQNMEGANGARFDPRVEQQGRMLAEARGRPKMLRFASLAADSGASICMRVLKLDEQITADGFEALGYLPSQIEMLERATNSEGGAVVISGVVNSGKSTAMAKILSKLPPYRKLITLEDPVEYLIPGAIQNTISRPLGSTSKSAVSIFGVKLMQVKRSAMTDLFIGEIRDDETGEALVDMCTSGTNTYATTHAERVHLIPDRLASQKIRVPRDFLSTPGMLKLLVYQALLPTLCRHCSLPLESLFAGGVDGQGRARNGDYWRKYGERFHNLFDIDQASLRIRNPEGCAHCNSSGLPDLFGLAGRTVVSEMIEPSVDEEFLRLSTGSDQLALRRYIDSLRVSDYSNPDMTGKTAMDCAIYKASKGILDPRDIEQKFEDFTTFEMRRRRRETPSLHVIAGHTAVERVS